VLVVDDEPLIGQSVARLLTRHYDVSSTTDPREALARLWAGEAFDVILCDLLMPELSGMAFYDEVARIAPAQTSRMLFMTAGSVSPEAGAFLERHGVGQLAKPFDAVSLAQAFRSLGR
jgi:CheY-like chemotaxis protein